MALSITVDTDHNLIPADLELLKTFLGIELSDTEKDEILKFYINGVSDWARRYANNFGAGLVPMQLKKGAVTEYGSGDGTNIYFPVSVPINSVTNMYDDLDRAYGSSTDISTTGKIIITNQNTRIEYDGNIFLKGYNNLKLVYNAGYDPIPNNLVDGCLEIVRFLYKDSEENRSGITSRTIAGGSLTIETSKLPKDTLSKIDLFVKKW